MSESDARFAVEQAEEILEAVLTEFEVRDLKE